MLGPQQIEHYRTHGYLSPLAALTSQEATHCDQHLQALIASKGWPLDAASRHKPHLYLKWVSDLVHHPAIVAAVADILGEDVLAWRSAFFIKPPRDKDFVPWHQDSIYWGFDPPDVLTAWIALTDSNLSNGCVRIAAGSHLGPEAPHRRRLSPRNLLLRGQSAAVEVPDEQIRALELEAGQFSLHHVKLLHSSTPNPSDRWRTGLAIRYLAGHVGGRGQGDGVTVVRGGDRSGCYQHEPRPARDYDPEALAWHARSVRRYGRQVAREILTQPSLANLISLGRIALKPGTYRKALGYLRRGEGDG